MAKRKAVLGVYGNVGLVRGWCEACEDWAFVLDAKMACCDGPAGDPPTRWKRMSQPEYRRKQPPVASQDEILAHQGYRCFYCDQSFGTQFWRKNSLVRLDARWDHTVPYTFSANNTEANFVAACQLCNGWKSDLVFDTPEAARVYLADKWNDLRGKEAEKDAEKERARRAAVRVVPWDV